VTWQNKISLPECLQEERSEFRSEAHSRCCSARGSQFSKCCTSASTFWQGAVRTDLRHRDGRLGRSPVLRCGSGSGRGLSLPLLQLREALIHVRLYRCSHVLAARSTPGSAVIHVCLLRSSCRHRRPFRVTCSAVRASSSCAAADSFSLICAARLSASRCACSAAAARLPATCAAHSSHQLYPATKHQGRVSSLP